MQDAGQVVPAGVVVVVKQNGKARLCRADEVSREKGERDGRGAIKNPEKNPSISAFRLLKKKKKRIDG